MPSNDPLQLMRDKYRRDRPPQKTGTAKEKYATYLDSPTWQRKRNLVMMRAKGICEGCGINKATEVHHLTYAHVNDEFLFELVALCGACHDRWHEKMERKPTP